MKTRSRVPGKDLPVTNAGRIDTATGAPASGPAALPGPAPEPPGRRPALRPRVPTLVAVPKILPARWPGPRAKSGVDKLCDVQKKRGIVVSGAWSATSNKRYDYE